MWREVEAAIVISVFGIGGVFLAAWLAWRGWGEPGEIESTVFGEAAVHMPRHAAAPTSSGVLIADRPTVEVIRTEMFEFVMDPPREQVEVEHHGADEGWSPAADVAAVSAVELSGEPVLFDAQAWDAIAAELGAAVDRAFVEYENATLSHHAWVSTGLAPTHYIDPAGMRFAPREIAFESTQERIDRWLREGGALTDTLHGELLALVAA